MGKSWLGERVREGLVERVRKENRRLRESVMGRVERISERNSGLRE